jgi:nucleoid-associated protein YgaU
VSRVKAADTPSLASASKNTDASGAKAQALAADLAQAKGDLETTRSQLEAAQRDAADAKARFEAQDAARSSELAAARQALDAATASADEAKKQAAATAPVDPGAAARAAELDEAKAELAAMRSQLADAVKAADTAKSDLAAANSGRISTDQQVADLTDRLNAALRSAAILQQENARLNRQSPIRPSNAAAVQAALQPPPPPPAPAPRTYTVVDGDTLTGISLKFYGGAGHWRRIYDANRGTMANEGSLSIGMVLVIP